MNDLFGPQITAFWWATQNCYTTPFLVWENLYFIKIITSRDFKHCFCFCSDTEIERKITQRRVSVQYHEEKLYYEAFTVITNN